MAAILRPGMEVDGSDGHKLGTIHRLFSATAAMRPEPDEIDLDPTDEEHRHLDDVSPVYDAALLGTAEYGSSQASGIAPFVARDTSPTPAEMPEGAMTFSPDDTKYMEVHHHGLLGLQHEKLYIPFVSVDAISEDTVTLACTRDEAMQLYGDKPAPIEDEPPAR